jgi:hypothetical protein
MAARVDVRAFEVSPILGAYYVCCVPTSVLVNQILERFGRGSWQAEVEHTVQQHVEPLRIQARILIRDHRFVIRGLERFPGMLTRNEDNIAAMMKRAGVS